ncbi:MAG: hypothetical protein OXI63_26075 [Candidatus Poribacteria bacterium]|nr:hypothetical protein [Candidatus Poribacteria bacterium]
MSKLTITEAVKVIPVSESTLRRDLKSGKVSFETDAKNRKQIDISELTRVYGQLKQSNGIQPPAAETSEHAEPVNDAHQTPSMNGNETYQNPSMTDTDTPKIVDLLENQIADLKTQLAQASDRETTLTSEKSKLLDMLSAEQEKTRVLMLPNPEKKRNWLDRLTRR